MLPDERLRIAVPSKGRLREAALSTLERAGLHFRVSGRRLFSVCSDTGVRIIFMNSADIPVLVAEGVVDLGITGSDQVLEKGVSVVEHRRLGFGRCRLSVAVHKDAQAHLLQSRHDQRKEQPVLETATAQRYRPQSCLLSDPLTHHLHHLRHGNVEAIGHLPDSHPTSPVGKQRLE